MIRCHIAHLEARCSQRGYTLEQVRPCIVSQDGDRLVVDELHEAYPRAKHGLGDMVAAGLDAVGITKERVQAVASAVGVKDCGCKKRQDKLNELGRKLGIG